MTGARRSLFWRAGAASAAIFSSGEMLRASRRWAETICLSMLGPCAGSATVARPAGSKVWIGQMSVSPGDINAVAVGSSTVQNRVGLLGPASLVGFSKFAGLRSLAGSLHKQPHSRAWLQRRTVCACPDSRRSGHVGPSKRRVLLWAHIRRAVCGPAAMRAREGRSV